MFHVRDYSIFSASPNAPRSFSQLRRMDMAINGLLLMLAFLCAWNIGNLVELRAIEVQDLKDVRSITDSVSTRLIWGISALTLVLIGWREWRVGERTIGLVYPLMGVLTALLVPAMMTEIQPTLDDHTVRIVMYNCDRERLVNGNSPPLRYCEPHEIHPGEIQLANANPITREFDLVEQVSGGQNAIGWNMRGRGQYNVYVMINQPDMDTCQQRTVFSLDQGILDPPHYTCAEIDGKTWMVWPQPAGRGTLAGLHLVEVQEP